MNAVICLANCSRVFSAFLPEIIFFSENELPTPTFEEVEVTEGAHQYITTGSFPSFPQREILCRTLFYAPARTQLL